MSVLWLMPPMGVSEGQKYGITPMLKQIGLTLNQIYWAKVGNDVSELKRWIAVTKPKMIVVNCELTLRLLQKGGTLDKCRGSIYNVLGTRAICIGDLKHLYSIKHGRWLLMHDFSKLYRWLVGKTRPQVEFVYSVCRDFHDVVNAVEWLGGCDLISADIETVGMTIRCIGYYGVNKDGIGKGFVIPFYNAFKPGHCHWVSENEEALVWRQVQKLHANDSSKILQNGSYDQAYFIRHNVPADNALLDSMHLWHSIFCELPKKINFMASVVLDYYVFWKDEGKGSAEAKKKSAPRFKTSKDQEDYWRYCALDNYYTWYCGYYLAQMLVNPKYDWALVNFIDEMLLQFGPAQSGSMKGFKSSTKRLEILKRELCDKSTTRLAELKIIADNKDFNPGSAQQYASLLYDVLQAKPIVIKGSIAATAKKNDGKSTDENILKKVADQSPILRYVIEKVYDYKKPKNNISKYCHMRRWMDERFLYQLNAAGTETTRFAGNNHQFWIGSNPQNVPTKLRHMVAQADKGYIFFEADYAQSDAKFVAYESEDPNYIEVMERKDGFDTHCYHAAHFFKNYTYEQILKGYQDGDDLFAADPTGIRALTKRFVHGGNYDMAGWTLYMRIGKQAAIAAAKAFGYKDCHTWSDKQFAEFMQSVLNSLWKLYPRVPDWKKEEVERAILAGNRVTNCFGRTRLMIGDLKNDKGMQRELIAYLGQSGTAGNINRSMRTIHYDTQARNDLKFHMLTQTHDSMLFLFPEKYLHECARYVLTVMEKPVTVKGREMFVRADAKVGYSWGKGLMKYKKDLTIENLMDHELKLMGEFRWKRGMSLDPKVMA